MARLFLSITAAPSIIPTVPQLLVGVLLLFVALVLSLRFQRWKRRRGLNRRWSEAREAEVEAVTLLRESGYEVLGAQLETDYSLMVDGEPQLVQLRADYLVSRRGLTYVAEVKSGRKAPQLANSATRRQLLEYSIAYGVDGVLLVDATACRIHRVEFPSRQVLRARNGGAIPLMIAASIVVATCAWYAFVR